jgi:hypothetical protein
MGLLYPRCTGFASCGAAGCLPKNPPISSHPPIPIARMYPLEQVRDAFRELAARHSHGKIVLLP